MIKCKIQRNTLISAIILLMIPACGGNKNGSVGRHADTTASIITIQPVSQTRTIGERVTFTVVATGDSLHYQWKKDGANIGTDSANYAIAAAALDDAGSYTVTVSSQTDSITSDAAVLTLLTHPLGIGIGGIADYNEERLYADIVRTSRYPNDVDTWDPIPQGVDENGWPKGDFKLFLWANKNMDGTYSISFNGQAESAGVSCMSKPIAITYDADANKSTGTFTCAFGDAVAHNVWLTMKGTKRTSSSAENTGVTNIKIMRPTEPGGSTPFAEDVLLNTQLPKLLAKVQVVRFMDFLSTNGNPLVTWDERALPSYASHSVQRSKRWPDRGIGGPYEHVIMLANQTGKDVWLNVPAMADTPPIIKQGKSVGDMVVAGMPSSKTTFVVKVAQTGDVGKGAAMQFSTDGGKTFAPQVTPGDEVPININGTPVWVGFINCWHKADDSAFYAGDTFTFTLDPAAPANDYVTKLAQLFAFGSDGVNPYTSPQANPVYPPLHPDLKLYVEYSNEVWNYYFPQGHWNKAQAQAEVAAGVSPLNFDDLNDTGGYSYAARRTARRAVDISTIFRQVFGDAAMGTRIRPVIETQGANPAVLDLAMQIIWGYYGCGMANCTSQPHPPSYYLYGGGGSGYYDPKPARNQGEDSEAYCRRYIDSININSIWTMGSMDTDYWASDLARNTDFLAVMGLKQVAYEGGPSLDAFTSGDCDGIPSDTDQEKAEHDAVNKRINDIYNQAWSDQRMRTAVVDHHIKAWDAVGSDLLVYFQAAWSNDFQWAFVRDINDLATPKMSALDDIGKSATGTITYGTVLPATIDGKSVSIAHNGSPSNDSYSLNTDGRASYTLHEPTGAQRTVVLTIDPNPNGDVAVYVDGAQIGTTQTATAGTMTFPAVNLAPGIHGVTVRAVSGSFSLAKVAVN